MKLIFERTITFRLAEQTFPGLIVWLHLRLTKNPGLPERRILGLLQASSSCHTGARKLGSLVTSDDNYHRGISVRWGMRSAELASGPLKDRFRPFLKPLKVMFTVGAPELARIHHREAKRKI